MERVIHGDFSLKDWVTVFSLVNGTLPKAACEAVFTTGDKSRGLFAATKFESAQGGLVKFNLVGEVKNVWVNGQPVPAGAEFTAGLKPGVNTLLVQFDSARLPDVMKLSSGDISFLTN